MSSAVDIQIVSTPNLEKIESFFKDVSYRETIEFSANFNTRLCVERRLRLPFFDPQTGVAQNHSQLFMDKRQRMPGFRQGQIYTYPAARWRKGRRQYLNKLYRFPDRPFQALRNDHEALVVNTTTISLTGGTASPTVGNVGTTYDPELNGTLLEESSSLGAAGGDTSDSKDSQQQQQQQQQIIQPQHHQHQHLHQQKEELPKEWLFYDEADINDVDSLEEPKSPADDEYDYDPRYGSKKRRKRRPGKRTTLVQGEGGGRRRSGAGRGRVSAADSSISALDSIEGDVTASPTSSGARRPRGSGTRGRRRTKNTNTNVGDPPSPSFVSEPPSFESAAAAVGVVGDMAVVEEHGELRNYRKYL